MEIKETIVPGILLVPIRNSLNHSPLYFLSSFFTSPRLVYLHIISPAVSLSNNFIMWEFKWPWIGVAVCPISYEILLLFLPLSASSFFLLSPPFSLLLLTSDPMSIDRRNRLPIPLLRLQPPHGPRIPNKVSDIPHNGVDLLLLGHCGTARTSTGQL